MVETRTKIKRRVDVSKPFPDIAGSTSSEVHFFGFNSFYSKYQNQCFRTFVCSFLPSVIFCSPFSSVNQPSALSRLIHPATSQAPRLFSALFLSSSPLKRLLDGVFSGAVFHGH